jgi:hypothetical protein
MHIQMIVENGALQRIGVRAVFHAQRAAGQLLQVERSGIEKGLGMR